MFFYEKIKNIAKNDRVLEVGPGNTPYYRSDILLEKIFEDDEIAFLQSGATEKRNLNKKTIYYDGDIFPFHDNEFDYIVCSHVLEHIPIFELDQFISEMTRVAKKGYIEVPLYSYEFLANIEHHLSLINVDKNNKLHFYKKNNEIFKNDAYTELYKVYAKSGIASKIIQSNISKIIYGFEWSEDIDYEIVYSFEDLKSVQGISYEKFIINKFYLFQARLKKFTNINSLKQTIYQKISLFR